MFRRFRPKIRVYGNRRHGCSFKSYNQLSYMKWRRISSATKLLSRIFKTLKIPQNFQSFNIFFLFQNFSLQNQNFQKTVQYVRGQWLMNMCIKFQVDIFKNGSKSRNVLLDLFLPGDLRSPWPLLWSQSTVNDAYKCQRHYPCRLVGFVCA